LNTLKEPEEQNHCFYENPLASGLSGVFCTSKMTYSEGRDPSIIRCDALYKAITLTILPLKKSQNCCDPNLQMG
jgi:hypothetical protein